MLKDKLFVGLCWIQGVYNIITALWALVHIRSFMMVTGPKTDTWLVKLVALLLLAIGAHFIIHTFIKTNPLPVVLLGITSAAALAGIDFYYTANHTIRWIYAVDGVIEVVFILVWIRILVALRKGKQI